MKKKIVIFSFRGGYGHVSASDALYETLKDDYEIKIIYAFEDLLQETDFVSRCTKNKLSFHKLYNYLLQKQYTTLINIISKLGFFFPYFFQKKKLLLLDQFIKTHKPDCIISVSPLINDSIITITKKYDVPFFLIPTDIDCAMFLTQISQHLYEKFYLCPIMINADVIKQIERYKIPKKHVFAIGALLKKDFFNQHLLHTAIMQEFNFPKNIPIVMILMGGQGSKKIIELAKFFSTYHIPIHLIFCIGKSEHLKKHIDNITFNPHISYTTIGFTKKIANLMSIATIIITKSGTLSLTEALYSGKPIILDGTTNILSWEKYNHTFITRQQFGFSVKNYRELSETLKLLLEKKDSQVSATIQLKSLDKKNGAEEIKKLLSPLLQ